MTATLQADRLTRIHTRGRGRSLTALDHVSLEVVEGRSTAVVGTSGAGKSTLLHLLLGLDRPTSGRILLDGQTVEGAAAWRRLRRVVQYVPQDPASTLDPRRPIGRQVREPLERLAAPGNHDECVLTALHRVGLDESFLDRRAHQISGGQAQRVALARALVTTPRILLADEPTSGLDLPLKHQVIDLLGELTGQGLGLCLVTHDLGAARTLCQDAHVMSLGRIVESAPVADLFQNPQHSTTRELLAAIPRLLL